VEFDIATREELIAAVAHEDAPLPVLNTANIIVCPLGRQKGRRRGN
jgi:hypothetical protein